MNTVAIILAAGMGTRLRPETERVPKCLVNVKDKPILEYQLEMLEAAGVNKVYIVGGYLAEELRDYILKSRFSFFSELVVNDEYNTSNNMYSLKIAFGKIWDTPWDIVYVLNGDVVYERDFLTHNQNSIIDSGVFVDRTMYIDESMKITVGADGFISDISKKINEDSHYAVSVDMYRFRRYDAEIFYGRIKEIISSGLVNQWTEVALSELFKEGKLKLLPIDISGSIWWEIDNQEDRARTLFRLKLLHSLQEIANCKLFAFDLDGTVNLGNKPIKGAVTFLKLLKESGKKIAFITNNSSMNNREHKERIERILGIAIEQNEVFSSLDHLKDYMASKKYSRIFYVLNSNALSELGVHQNDVSHADAVVIGFDTEVTYEKLKKAVIHIHKGADLIVVHPDVRCPTDEGFIPDAGSLAQLIESVTGKNAAYVGGKPNPQMIVDIASKFGVKLNEVAYFGDRVYTDIKMVERLPAKAFLMLTGETDFQTFLSEKELIENLETNNVFLGENLTFMFEVLKRII